MPIQTVDIQNTKGIQAINIPNDFKINDNKVYIKQVGNALYIFPFHNPWQNLADSLNDFTVDYMNERNQPNEQSRELFD